MCVWQASEHILQLRPLFKSWISFQWLKAIPVRYVFNPPRIVSSYFQLKIILLQDHDQRVKLCQVLYLQIYIFFSNYFSKNIWPGNLFHAAAAPLKNLPPAASSTSLYVCLTCRHKTEYGHSDRKRGNSHISYSIFQLSKHNVYIHNACSYLLLYTTLPGHILYILYYWLLVHSASGHHHAGHS